MGKIGPNCSHLLTVRAKEAEYFDPLAKSRPLKVSPGDVVDYFPWQSRQQQFESFSTKPAICQIFAIRNEN